MHPWITRDENGIVPLNFHDQIEMTNKLYDKLKNVQNLVFTLTVLRNKFFDKNKESLLDEYKYQIIKEEFLDFTPTPKKEEKDLESFDAYSQNVLYNSSALKKGKFTLLKIS